MDLCIVFGPVISVAVQIFKRIPFIRKNPKTVATILSIAISVVGAGAGAKLHLQALVQCVLTVLSGAVATHEIVLKPVTRMFVAPESRG